jgi:hypothetical protein
MGANHMLARAHTAGDLSGDKNQAVTVILSQPYGCCVSDTHMCLLVVGEGCCQAVAVGNQVVVGQGWLHQKGVEVHLQTRAEVGQGWLHQKGVEVHLRTRAEVRQGWLHQKGVEADLQSRAEVGQGWLHQKGVEVHLQTRAAAVVVQMMVGVVSWTHWWVVEEGGQRVLHQAGSCTPLYRRLWSACLQWPLWLQREQQQQMHQHIRAGQ